MDKIVILSSDCEEGAKLIACLSILFPECKLQLVSRPGENYEEVQAVLEPASGDNGGKKDGPRDVRYEHAQY